MPKKIVFFDSHLHIIDPRFPLLANNGYLPDASTYKDYLKRVSNYQVTDCAIVPGSLCSGHP